ncbi:hypothetical protein GQ600_13167 [Phytophthora cactorum]|nr:hypothetical protein GQ600_13167 [Phytophthora cactorum]
MKNDEWMQLFKPIPKRKADDRLSPTNCNTCQLSLDEPSRGGLVSLLLRWGMRRDVPVDDVSPRLEPDEAGAALQKWKKKLRKAFGAIGINEGKQPAVARGTSSRNGLGRRQTNTDDSSSDADDLFLSHTKRRPSSRVDSSNERIAALNDSDPTPRIDMARTGRWIVSSRSRAHATRWLRTFVYEMTGTIRKPTSGAYRLN